MYSNTTFFNFKFAFKQMFRAVLSDVVSDLAAISLLISQLVIHACCKYMQAALSFVLKPFAVESAANTRFKT